MSLQKQQIKEKQFVTIDELKSHQWFASLTQDQLEALAPLFFVEAFQAEEDIFSKYAKANTLFFVLSGEVRFKAYDRARNEDDYSAALPHSVFGEVGFFQAEKERTAPARAFKETRVLILARADFDKAQKLFPDLTVRVCEVMADRLTAIDKKIMETVYIGPFQNRKISGRLRFFSSPGWVALYIVLFLSALVAMSSDFKWQEFIALLMGTMGAIFGTLILRFQLEQGKHSEQGEEQDILGIKRQLEAIERHLLRDE